MLRLLAAKAVLGSACRASSAGRSTFVAAANAAQTKAVPWRAALSCCGSSRRGLQSRAASFATFRRSAVEGGVPCVNASRRVAFFNGNQVTGWGQRVASLSMRRGQIRGNSDKSAHAQRQANSGSAKGSANGANAGGKSGGSGGSGGNESSPKNFAMTTFLKTGAVIVQLVVVTNLVKNYVFDFTHCVGSSMLPTFNRVGDLALTEHLTFYTRDPRRGDVVLSKSPLEPDKVLLKRIIAVAGDTVYHRDKARFRLAGIDGRKLTVVPKGHVWLEGDNPDLSTDSRDFGPVPLGLIRSRVVLKLWPLSEFGSIPARTEMESQLL